MNAELKERINILIQTTQYLCKYGITKVIFTENSY